MEELVQLEGVSKIFGKTTAVNDVSFSIEKGSTVAILGPNGAGKTTTVSMMLGLLEPSQGEIKVFGKSPKELDVRNRIGAMLQEVSVVDKLRVREIIDMVRSYYSSPLSLEELISITGLTDDELKKWANKLSGGQKRRVGFALALAGDPDLLFLDEPTVGLDITARRIFWEKIQTLKKQGKTIIFTTHYLQEADDFSDRIILFNNGEIIADGKPAEIKHKIATRSVSFETNDHNVIDQLNSFNEVIKCFEKEGRIYVITGDTDAVLALIFQHNIDARNIFIEQGRLEEAFEHLTSTHQEVV
ncbi:ABC transporter ATP-binding protein [Bacillaceae bacterium W0354]